MTTTSLMKCLLETLPFAGLQGKIGDLEYRTWDEIAQRLVFVPSGQSFPAISRTLEDARDYGLLWGVQPGTDPAKFGALNCRVQEQDFDEYTVLDSLEFGCEYPAGGVYACGSVDTDTYLPNAVITKDGIAHQLPLTDEFLLQSWFVQGGGLIERANTTWPVAAEHEWSMMRVFVHEIGYDGAIRPLTPIDDSERDQLQRLEAICGSLAEGSVGPDSPEGDVPFGALLQMDELLTTDASAYGGVNAGEMITFVVRPIRFVTVISLTVTGETWNYQPGGLGGVGRVYPIAMVRAPVDIQNIHLSIRFNRPATTTTSGAMHCSQMNHAIGPLLVTDTNKDSRLFDLGAGPPLTFWSNLFNYQVADGSIGNQIMHVVKWQQPLGRTDTTAAVHREPPCAEAGVNVLFGAFGLGDRPTSLVKAPRQGEFDNVHLAPSMHLNAAVYVSELHSGISPLTAGAARTALTPADRAALALDDIKMAPICAHDCFHLHWRWTDAGAEFPQRGFVGQTPNQLPGTPMVPANQDIFVWMRSPHEMTYHIVACAARADSWTIGCHHGAGYAVNARTSAASLLRLATKGFVNAVFYDADGKVIDAESSWAYLYWHHRYQAQRDANGAWTAVDRTTMRDARAARDL